MIILGTLASLFVLYLVGILFLWAISGKRPGLHQSLSLGFGIGSGVLSLSMFYLAFWGVPLTRRTIAWLIFLMVLALAMVILLRWRRTPTPSPGKSASGAWSRLEKVLFILIGFTFLLVLADALSQSMIGFDSRAIWGMKAKILCSQHAIYAEDFFDPDRLHAKNRYPLLVPFVESFTCVFSNGLNDRATKVAFPIFYLSLLCLFYGALKDSLNRLYSLLGTTMFAVLPVFLLYRNGGVASGYADLPLAYFATATVIHLYRWYLFRLNETLVVAGCFGLFASFTKNEGIPLTAISFSVFILISLLKDPKWRLLRASKLTGTVFVASMLLVPWLFFRSQMPITDEDFERLVTVRNLAAGLNRLPEIFFRLFQEYFLKPHVWNVFGFLLLYPLTECLRHLKFSLKDIFLFIPFLYVLVTVAVLMVTPWELRDLIPVALTRLTMHTVPLTFIWFSLAFQWKKLLSA